MKKIIKEEIVKIAQVHEKRLSYALKSLIHLIPFKRIVSTNHHVNVEKS